MNGWVRRGAGVRGWKTRGKLAEATAARDEAGLSPGRARRIGAGPAGGKGGGRWPDEAQHPGGRGPGRVGERSSKSVG